MKLGDIKAEALRLMFVNFNYNISASDITRLAIEDTYGSYIVNMNGSINRCLDIMERKGVLAADSARAPSYEDYASAAALALENSEFNILEQAARLIPLYIKSELYAEEEQRAALDARNLFDYYVDELVASLETPQTNVVEKYNMGQW